MSTGRFVGWLALAGCVCLVLLGAEGCGQKAPAAICRVAEAAGDVTVIRSAGQRSEAAAKGTELAAGDRLSTGAKSSALLEYADFATVAVGEKSQYVIHSQLEDKKKGFLATSSELLKGIGLVKVKPGRGKGFEVKTPHVITGVLGTMYGLEVNEGETLLSVLHGRVRCDSVGGGSAEVSAGDGARCDGKLPPAVMKKFVNTKVPINEALQNFFKADSGLPTVFRYY